MQDGKNDASAPFCRRWNAAIANTKTNKATHNARFGRIIQRLAVDIAIPNDPTKNRITTTSSATQM